MKKKCIDYLVILQFLLIHSMYAKHLERIKESEIEHYKPMLFNEKDSKIIVGARNHILIMNQTDFESSMLEDYVSRLDIEKMKNCYQKGVDQEYCNNFITTLLQIPPIINYTKQGQILVCGTYSYSPECQIRQLNDNFDIVAKSTFIHSPHSPYWNTTSLLTKKGEFFFGGPLDYRGVDVTIIKQINILPTQEPEYVRGIQNNHYWINKDASFFASFQYDRHVYFLFRESDIEFANVDGHHVVSRIGRVCTNDTGVENFWTTFLKARTDSLYFGTEKEFIRLSIDQCEKYQQKEECIHSGDPYCGWNQIHEKCIRSTNDNLQDENFIQSDRPSCHQSWSEWFICSVTDSKSIAKHEICHCRRRPCQADSNNDCFKGFEYEVTDCIVYYSWTMLFIYVITAVILCSILTVSILFCISYSKDKPKKPKTEPKLSFDSSFTSPTNKILPKSIFTPFRRIPTKFIKSLIRPSHYISSKKKPFFSPRLFHKRRDVGKNFQSPAIHQQQQYSSMMEKDSTNFPHYQQVSSFSSSLH
ncbi:uncharacterized protein LOC142644796 [Dermatophagoides pteronyssinus]|uniref:uncharacterized protein LOC142644796 n=1 Tax=Dermatophagoides pteronyssinus TaxID=6956 RepID=UPI003F67C593